MISIVHYLTEGKLFDKLDQKFQQTALAKTVDKANDRIDKTLEKSAAGRLYMKAEDATGKLAIKGGNVIANWNDRLHGRNFKVRK